MLLTPQEERSARRAERLGAAGFWLLFGAILFGSCLTAAAVHEKAELEAKLGRCRADLVVPTRVVFVPVPPVVEGEPR